MPKPSVVSHAINNSYFILCNEMGVYACALRPWEPLSEAELRQFTTDSLTTLKIGVWNGGICYAAYFPAEPLASSEWCNLRQLVGVLSDECFQLVSRAWQIVMSSRDNQYCGRCGGLTSAVPNDTFMCCTQCGHVVYPRVSPCVLVVVSNESRILLARSPRFPSGLFSAIAGFIEPAETLEEAVAREVKEEVGIDITDIDYYASQPWPFPHQLMIGFHARYSAGEITPDGIEIIEADWFSKNSLPQLPPSYSLSRRLIEHVISKI